MEIVAARLDTDSIELFQKVIHKNKSEVVRDLVEAGKKHHAVELYKQRRVSLGLGATLAGVNLSEFLELLREHNIDLNITLEDVKAGIQTAKKVLR